ncbi:metallophosphoesterase, partial [candidate division KSB1 bacterium]|nr:metallophosphoesterase [candidate division KSB1 bacterium]
MQKKLLLILMTIFYFMTLLDKTCSGQSKNIFSATELLGRPTDRSVTVNAVAKIDLEVYFEYGTESKIYTNQTVKMTFPVGKPIEMVIDNLTSNTRYYYRMRYRQPGSPEFDAGIEHTFHTQRPRGSTFKFAIQADSHIYDKKCTPALYQTTIQNELNDTPDFLLDLGDTFGDDHDTTITRDDLNQLYFNQRYYFDAVCHSVPLFLCLGNHEVEYHYYMNGTPENIAIYATQARQFYYVNPIPNDFYTGNTAVENFVGLPENYYAWEWGDALFVVLDAYRYLTASQKPREWDWTIGEEQYRWFKTTLENSNAKFKFVFIHHILGQTRGGVIWADKFEWGGHNQKGVWEFDKMRPGWAKPIHQLMVDNGVTILFQGHDHIFVKEELDGIVYQECPMPSDATYDVGAENEDDYPSGIIVKNSGHLRVTVSDAAVTVDYVRAYLPLDETAAHRNGEVAFSYTINTPSTLVPSPKSSSATPDQFKLNQNFPNPFNP